jgi:hypothetical protein
MSLVRGAGGLLLSRLMKILVLIFTPGKDLGRVTPCHHFSPLLFNLVVDVFTRMLNKASDKGYVTGLMSSMNSAGVVSL